MDVEATSPPTRCAQFGRWLADAVAGGRAASPTRWWSPPPAPTARRARAPSCSRAYDDRGFVFFTNLGSRKGAELPANPRAALVFPWYALERQVRGHRCRVEPVDRAETEAYFATRPHGSRLGAWASPQSEVVAARAALDAALADVEAPLPRRRAGAGAAGLGRLPRGAGDGGVLGRPQRAACTTGCATGVPGSLVTAGASSGSPPERLRRTARTCNDPRAMACRGRFLHGPRVG